MGLLAEEIENAVKSCDLFWIKVNWDQAVTYRPLKKSLCQVEAAW